MLGHMLNRPTPALYPVKEADFFETFHCFTTHSARNPQDGLIFAVASQSTTAIFLSVFLYRHHELETLLELKLLFLFSPHIPLSTRRAGPPSKKDFKFLFSPHDKEHKSVKKHKTKRSNVFIERLILVFFL